MGKEAYSGETTGNDSPTYDDSSRESSSRIIEEKGIGLGEAADTYGDLRAAEEYGYVTRGLKSRHIQFIALGGTIGTGLFLGIGRAFTQAGPLSLLLGYSFTGFAVYAMVYLSTHLFGFGTSADSIPPRSCPSVKWQHGFHYLEQYRNSALGTSMGLWASLSAGSKSILRAVIL